MALRNTDEIESLAGGKGYDDQPLRDALRSDGVRPPIKHRLFAHYDHAHNTLNQTSGYTQRWMAETSYSTTKRSQASASRSRFWYRQFRETVLKKTSKKL